MADPILPGATLGILGGGQLGRMTAMAARSMGYDVHVLDPDAECAAKPLASRVIVAPYGDPDAAAELARGADAVTLEIEQIARPALEAAARHAPLRPGAEPVWIIQDRVRQKEWLATQAFPVGPFHRAESAEDVEAAVVMLGPSIVKAAHGGYDGRGQAHVADVDGAGAAWDAVGARRSVVEQRLDLALEFSVLVARGAGGQLAVYPPSLNYHAAGVLTWAATPAPIEPAVARAGAEVAIGIAEGLGIEGLLAVELFLTGDGRVLVNELAPRPHNTYHASERANATSQFEQLVRAACALPLGSPAPVGAGAIANLLGELWLADEAPRPTAALGVPTARLHLYGKREARAGRKMGHLSAVGARPEEALARVQDAYDAFRPTGLAPIPRSPAPP
ncbi:N5-carboxyaminoimidazole ribonucleotide synthase [Gemmatimonadetes bacterium T265]|nr:N5-carboxyaminoimidazole ribonucleotide synthase [Gemmatimonadetes bacterium T265]